MKANEVWDSVMKHLNNQMAVQAASDRYRGTCGESREAVRQHFLPAFINREDGRVELARLPNGQPAAMHLISHLPVEWALQTDPAGKVVALKASIEAGFVRDGCYYTRSEAASLAELNTLSQPG